MDLKEIQALIKFVSKSGAQEVSLETEDFKINIKTASGAAEQPTIIQAVAPQAAMPVAAASATPAAPVAPEVVAEEEDDDNGNYIEVKSPMIGTLYRSPSPEQDAFVKVGSEIKPGDVLCIVEAMKLFNEIESEVSGKIVKVLVDDQSPIEYDQPLFLVDPS
jgi:acetyl-CoA carboxylase biotin carboxyl carrier protein